MPETTNGVGIVVLWLSIGSYTLLAFILLWLLRSIALKLLKSFGLYNPKHYRLLPRLPWRRVASPLLRIESWIADFAIGKKQDAKWAGAIRTLTMMYTPTKVFLGRVRVFNLGWFMPVGIKTRRHLVMVAGTGGGKTTSVISMLALHRGNAFVIDPKGQIAHALHRRMGSGGDGILGKGGRSMVLDPTGIVPGVPSACWNPFDELDVMEHRHGPGAVPELAAKIAEALIQQDSQTQPIFANAAREFVKAVVLHIHTTEPPEQRTLMRLRHLINRGIEDQSSEQGRPKLTGIERLLMQMDQNTAYSAIANSIAAVRDALKRDNAGAFLSSANVQLGWIDFDRIANISRSSSFSLSQLKTGDLSLFICANTTDVQQTFTGWFRLLTILAMQSFEREPGRPEQPTLFVIDEMPSLGRVEAFETAAPVLRSYGLQLLAITQDLDLLSKAYPQTWSSFVGNADAVLWMSTNNQESLDYLQKVLGGRTSDDGRDRPIAYAEQLKRFLDPRRGNMVVTLNGERPLMLKTPHYFKELPVYHYAPDPNERETWMRRVTRFWLSGDTAPWVEAHGVRRNILSLLRWIGWLPAGYVVGAIIPGILYMLGIWLLGDWALPAFVMVWLYYGVTATLTTHFALAAAPVICRATKWAALSIWVFSSAGALITILGMMFFGMESPLTSDQIHGEDSAPAPSAISPMGFLIASSLGIIPATLILGSRSCKEYREEIEELGK